VCVVVPVVFEVYSFVTSVSTTRLPPSIQIMNSSLNWSAQSTSYHPEYLTLFISLFSSWEKSKFAWMSPKVLITRLMYNGSTMLKAWRKMSLSNNACPSTTQGWPSVPSWIYGRQMICQDKGNCVRVYGKV